MQTKSDSLRSCLSTETLADVWQVSGGGERGYGVGGEAAHRGLAADQEEVEGGERRQARAVLLQVRAEPNVCVCTALSRGCVNSFQRSFVSRRQTCTHPRPFCLSSSTGEPLLLPVDVLNVKGGCLESIWQALRGLDGVHQV